MKSITLRKSQWDKIKGHLNAHDIGKREIERQEAYIQSLNDMSNELKAKWAKFKEEEENKELEKLQEQEQLEFKAHMKFYKELMEKQKIDKEHILAERRDTFFKQKDEPRALESALLCSEMLKEQEKQREFNKEVKRREKQSDLEFARKMEKDYEQWLKDQKIKRHNKLIENQREFLLVKAQAEEKVKRKQREKTDQISSELKEMAITTKELEIDEQKALEKKEQLKLFTKIQKEEALAKMKQASEEEERYDKVQNKLIEVYSETKTKLQKDCEEKQKQIYNHKNQLRSLALKTFPDQTEVIKSKEERMFQKAQEEFKKRETEQIRRERERKAIIKEQTLQFYQDYLKEKEEQEAFEAELKKYEYEKRLEHENNTKAFNKIMEERELEKKLKIKNDILQQLKEKEEIKRRQEAERIQFFHTDKLEAMEAADKKFTDYADQLVEECEKTGKPTLPLLRVINSYKSRYLAPEKYTPSHLKTHAPPAQITRKEK